MRTATRLLAMVAVLALLSPAARAQVTLPHYDGFNYPAGSVLGGQGSWVNLNTGDTVFVVAGNLSYPGFAASSGNKVKFDGAGRDPAKQFDSTASGTVYYSFLLKVTAVGGLTTTGGYFAAFYNASTGSTTGAPVWTRLDGSSYDIGVSTRISSLVSWSPLKSLDSTYLIVGAYTFVAGDTNDVAKLWINPAASTFGKTEPAPTLTSVNNTGDLASVMRFFMRQDAVTLTPFIEMDEVRIGTKWADVTSASGSTYVIDKDAGVTPREFRLEQNYPNPFNPTTNIRFSILGTNAVSLKIRDVLGREVATLVDQTLAPGTYTAKWDATSYPSGVYFYTVRAGNTLETRRMILTK